MGMFQAIGFDHACDEILKIIDRHIEAARSAGRNEALLELHELRGEIEKGVVNASGW